MSNKPIFNGRMFRFHLPVDSEDVTFAFSLWDCQLDDKQRAAFEKFLEDSIFRYLFVNDIEFNGIDFGSDVTE